MEKITTQTEMNFTSRSNVLNKDPIHRDCLPSRIKWERN